MVTQTALNPYHQVLSQAGRATPALILDLAVLETDFREFLGAYQGTRLLYAMKANPHPEVLKKVASMGADFEIASQGELKVLEELGIPGRRIVCSNPIKNPKFVSELHAVGVRHMSFDSASEVDKIAEFAPGAEVLVRLNVPNTGSEWPLDKKFGVDGEMALFLLAYAREKGLRPLGLTFHVGSQCRRLESWPEAFAVAKDIWDQCVDRGISLKVIDAGGGVPIYYDNPEVPTITQVGRNAVSSFRGTFPSDVELWTEPGRGVVGRAGTMVTTVVGTAVRGATRWVYLDVGVFHGMAEALGGIHYRYLTDVEGPLEPCNVAGPSCDSMDVISQGALLPPVQCGDTVIIPACGAYTTVYSSAFNGFPGPETIIVNGGS